MVTETIKASELRIGNLRQVNGKYVNAVNGATIGHIEMGILDFIPIGLDEKWLIDFGFEYCGIEDVWRLGGFTLRYIQNGDYFICENIISCENEISRVHKLQNLFYALTGEELKRKCDE